MQWSGFESGISSSADLLKYIISSHIYKHCANLVMLMQVLLLELNDEIVYKERIFIRVQTEGIVYVNPIGGIIKLAQACLL